MFTRLRFERQAHQITQADLARDAGMPVYDLRLAESGRLIPTDEELNALARTLRVSPPSLLLRPAVLAPDADEVVR